MVKSNIAYSAANSIYLVNILFFFNSLYNVCMDNGTCVDLSHFEDRQDISQRGVIWGY